MEEESSLSLFSSSEHYSLDSPLPPSPEKLDLDELFGFSAARKRLEEKLLLEELVDPKFVPHRIFINNVDCFNAKYIARYLSDQIAGATKFVADEGENEEEQKEEEEDIEEEGEDEQHEKQVKKKKEEPELHKYEIFATLNDANYTVPEDVKEIISREPREEFLTKVMKCGYMIYDVTTDPTQIEEALWTLKAIEKELDVKSTKTPKAFRDMTDVRCFILISTVMTWALTKPIDPEEPDIPFTEQDYRKRKPHSNYKKHIALEKEVVQVGRKFPDKFKTLVVATGVSYGHEEDVLHFLFKMGWHNKSPLPIFGSGRNHVPLIHVQDIATIIHLFLEEFPPKVKYILAVEPTSLSLKRIVKAVSKTLTTGEYLKVQKEEAFLIPEVTQSIFEMLTVNLDMEPSYLTSESVEMKWQSETGFVDNIKNIVAEFRQARSLKAMKVVILGPPASGKTTVAKQISVYYRLHYLHIKEVIEYAIDEMKKTIERLRAEEEKPEDEPAENEEAEEEEDVEDEEDEEKETLEDVSALLEETTTDMVEHSGRLSDEYVIKLLKKRLLSPPCQNQGYVLDGYPKLLQQAKGIFGRGEEDEEDTEDDDEESPRFDARIMPEFVICLEASDKFLCDKVMRLPEHLVQDTHYTEEPMLRRLTEYRVNNMDEVTVLNFFDELEVHPFFVQVEEDRSPLLDSIVATIIEKIGEPRNYGPTAKEIEEMIQKAEEEERKRNEDELKRRQDEEMKAHDDRMEKMEEWVRLTDILKQEEEEILAIQAQPLRHYLMTYVLPTLTKALVQVAQVRPGDPVDYLAEYLFRENPEGKMFRPDYLPGAEDVFASVKRFQESINGDKTEST